MLLLFFIAIFLIPQLRFPFQVGAQKLISNLYSPIEVEDSITKASFFTLTLQNTDDVTVSLNINSKPTIINLWATWCPPCVAEMPSFQKLYEDYKDQVHFVFISNESTIKTRAFIENKNLTLPVYKTTGSLPKDIRSNQLPTTYVITKKGDIIVKKIGASNWDSAKFRELLDTILAE